MGERAIIDMLSARDEAGLAALLRHYGPLMRYVIAPILPNPQDQEECLSETALRVWAHIGQFDPQRGNWRAWLTAVARNTAVSHLRASRRHTDRQTPLEENQPVVQLLIVATLATFLGFLMLEELLDNFLIQHLH